MAASGIINQQLDQTTRDQPSADSTVMAPVADAQAPAASAQAPSGIIGSAQATLAVAPTPAPVAAAAPAAQPAAPVDHMADLNSLYSKDFGRAGDQAGMGFWSDSMNKGMSLGQVDQAMQGSDEYKALHPTATAPSATASGTPKAWDVTADQTVQGQVSKMIDPNSPLYQQWATAGAQDAAARGFTGNSSIRSTGIMDSVMRNATPIATADAATNAKAAGYNADMPNQFALKNADLSQQSALAHLSADTQKYVADQSASTQLAVQKMSTQSQQTISQAHDANSVLIASNDAAKSAYGNYVAAVAQIDQNDKMDATAKQSAIITQTQIFNNAVSGLKAATPGTADVSSPLDVSGANSAAAQVGGVDVSNYLNF